MALTKTARTIVANQNKAAGGAAIRGTIDLESAYGGILTLKIVNGGSAPTVACDCIVTIAHNATLPSAAAPGVDWKTIVKFNGGVVANATTEQHLHVSEAVMALQVEFSGNTGNDVTVEAFMSELTSPA